MLATDPRLDEFQRLSDRYAICFAFSPLSLRERAGVRGPFTADPT